MKKKIIRLIVVGIAASFFQTSPASARPNIILILADHLGWGEVGVYGQKKIKTPNLDRLAQGGIRFTQYYSGSSVCAPARCTLVRVIIPAMLRCVVTGDVRRRFGKYGDGNHPLAEGTITVATMLQKACYYTAAIGKWGLGRFGDSVSPNKQGLDHFFGYVCQLQAHTQYPNHLWRNGPIVEIPENDAKWGGSKHSHDLMTMEALGVIVEKPEDKPFFFISLIRFRTFPPALVGGALSRAL